MDAYGTVTAEEGDRYPLGPPYLILSSTNGSGRYPLKVDIPVRIWLGVPKHIPLSSNWLRTLALQVSQCGFESHQRYQTI